MLSMENFNCPNCGTQSPVELKAAKLAACPSCDTTLFLQDAQVKLAGKQGVMHDAPLLFGLGNRLGLGGKSIRLLGHARYSYGRGFWDEFCGIDTTGAISWISIDEGDVVVQERLPKGHQPKFAPPFKLGESLDFQGTIYRVSEVESAKCVALRGQFDETLNMGETYDFVDASAEDGTLLSGEFWDNTVAWFHGRWYDPFAIDVTKAT